MMVTHNGVLIRFFLLLTEKRIFFFTRHFYLKRSQMMVLVLTDTIKGNVKWYHMLKSRITFSTCQNSKPSET
jgi:hypothetical protein